VSLDTGRRPGRPRPAGRSRRAPDASVEAPPEGGSRGDAPLPLIVAGSVAGAAASGVALMALGLVSLVAWMLAPAAELEARTMLEIASGAWLAGQGLPIVIQGVTVTLLPLGFGLVSVALLAVAGRWATRASAVGRRGEALVVAATAALTYGLIAAIVALLARNLAVSPLRAFLVCGLLALVVVTVVSLRTSIPGALRAGPVVRDIAAGACAGALLLLAAGALGVLASLLLHMPDVGLLLGRLQPDLAGAVLITVLSLAYLPVVTVWSTSYLLGPGFTIGDGSVIAPLSDVPATTVPGLPLLAALPAEAPPFGVILPALGIGMGAIVGWLLRRRGRTALPGVAIAAGAALGTGAIMALASWVASGGLGVARLASLGPSPLLVGAASAGAILVGALAVVAWPARSIETTLTVVSEDVHG